MTTALDDATASTTAGPAAAPVDVPAPRHPAAAPAATTHVLAMARSGSSLRLARPSRPVHRVLRFAGAGHLVVR